MNPAQHSIPEIRAAAQRVAAMDATDGGPQTLLGPAAAARTAMFALEAALRTKDWNVAADAYVYLAQLHQLLLTQSAKN